MSHSKFFFLSVFVFLLTVATQASVTTKTGNSPVEVKPTNLIDQALFYDAENKVCFIDFEAINVNIDKVIVKSGEGDVIFSEAVSSLPVNTIYEIDFKPFGKGEFSVKLSGLLGEVIEKSILVK